MKVIYRIEDGVMSVRLSAESFQEARDLYTAGISAKSAVKTVGSHTADTVYVWFDIPLSKNRNTLFGNR
jgi:hypothetical protein